MLLEIDKSEKTCKAFAKILMFYAIRKTSCKGICTYSHS